MKISNFSKVYDDLHELVGGLLPDHEILYNPYRPEDNDNLTLAKAWGITALNADNTQREMNCSFSVSQEFELILTKQAFTGNFKSETSRQERIDKEKLLYDENNFIGRHLQNNTYLKDEGFENLAKVVMSSMSGINFVRGENSGILILRSILTVEYFESLTEE